MSALHFSHIALSCKKPLETEQFYTKHFGFKRARVIPLGKDQIVFIKKGYVSFELFQSSQEAPIARVSGSGQEYPGYRHIAFQVEDVDAKLAEMGEDAIVTLGPMNFDEFIPGWRSAWIVDPDGNIVEISQGYVEQECPPKFSAQQGEK